ncbi:MAG TPA: hypothetical protein VIL07_06365 [Symbiobacteriaceae bacterium]
MSTFEENWETGAVVTAEAVSGIGFSGKFVDDEDTSDTQWDEAEEEFLGAAD